ncbi:MAG TPA: DUF4142 domain-containing protein [Polyangiaceae bacterium]|jgi:hypothetical protein
MHKSILVALVLVCGCAHHEMHALDVTTTSATIEPRAAASARNDTLESAVGAYQAESADAPGPLPSAAPTDEQVAAVFESAGAAESARALYALGHASNPTVQRFAALVYERMRDARVGLSMLAPAPDVAPPSTDLRAVAGQSLVDFDRVYVGIEKTELAALAQKLDELAPRVSDARIAQRLLELRPLVDTLYAQAFGIQQALR